MKNNCTQGKQKVRNVGFFWELVVVAVIFLVSGVSISIAFVEAQDTKDRHCKSGAEKVVFTLIASVSDGQR